MKGSKIYMLFLCLFLVIVFLHEYMSPHEFSWKPTYDKNDKEPFGSYIFDDVLSSSIDDYTVINKTFYQIIQEDSAAQPRAFLLTENNMRFNETDMEFLLKLINSGNQIMICTENFPYILGDTICFETAYGGYFSSSFGYYANSDRSRDSIFFGTDTLNPECIFEVYPQIHPVSIVQGKTKWVYNRQNDTIPNISMSSKNDTTSDIYMETESTLKQEAKPADEYNTDAYLPETDTGTMSETEAEHMMEAETETEDETETDFETPDFTAIRDTEPDSESDTITNPEDNLTVAEYLNNREQVFHPLKCDSSEVLVWNNQNKPLVLRVFLGKGELFLVSTPLMFTNYSILDRNNASYAFRLLSYMKDKPLVRIEAYGKHSDEPETPLRYILSETPLRWAIYSILLLLLLFMFFTARRRQRIIPVVQSPPNRTFGFMQLISNLYYQKHNNGEVIKMKYTYFCAEVKRLIGIELKDEVPDVSDYTRLSEKTGIDKDFISILLKDIRVAIYQSSANDLQLKKFIDGMNDILRALKS